MTAFRAYLVVVLVCLTGYTAIVGSNHGWNLLPIFFSEIGRMAWPGQFNVDFMTFLGLAGLWVAWRHHFSGAGIALGVLAIFGGMIFLAPYLLWASVQSAGDVRALLLGRDRATASISGSRDSRSQVEPSPASADSERVSPSSTPLLRSR